MTGAAYERLRYLWGAEVLFDPTLRAPDARPRAPIAVAGVVVHNDPRDDPAVFVGRSNPGLAEAELRARCSDKWEEYLFLREHAPTVAPPTVRMDTVLADSGMLRDGAGVGAGEPRAFFTALQAELDRRFGRWIMKTRTGFGSDGRLPKSGDDLAALWAVHETELVPARERLAAEVRDQDLLVEKTYEELPGAESIVLEALWADPTSVIVQPLLEHRAELRVHVVEGHVLEGATTSRWWDPAAALTKEDQREAEGALQALLEKVPPLSAAADVLLTSEGPKIIDLNIGLESGMYFPENDLYITNLLAERLSGRETPFLSDLRRFERAPLDAKLGLARALERKVGELVRETEAFGLWDRVLAGYVAEVEAKPSREVAVEALRQLRALRLPEEEDLEAFTRHPAVRRWLAPAEGK